MCVALIFWVGLVIISDKSRLRRLGTSNPSRQTPSNSPAPSSSGSSVAAGLSVRQSVQGASPVGTLLSQAQSMPQQPNSAGANAAAIAEVQARRATNQMHTHAVVMHHSPPSPAQNDLQTMISKAHAQLMMQQETQRSLAAEGHKGVILPPLYFGRNNGAEVPTGATRGASGPGGSPALSSGEAVQRRPSTSGPSLPASNNAVAQGTPLVALRVPDSPVSRLVSSLMPPPDTHLQRLVRSATAPTTQCIIRKSQHSALFWRAGEEAAIPALTHRIPDRGLL